MARTCQNCGQKLRARDKYCAECGVPVGAIVAPAQAQLWDYCELTWSARGFLASDKSYFWAQDMVTGVEVLRGKDTFRAREVTETRAYPADDRRTNAVMAELVGLLRDEDWQPIATSGSGWWNQRFVRIGVG